MSLLEDAEVLLSRLNARSTNVKASMGDPKTVPLSLTEGIEIATGLKNLTLVLGAIEQHFPTLPAEHVHTVAINNKDRETGPAHESSSG